MTSTYSAVLTKLRMSFKSGKTKPIEWRIKQLRGLLKFLEKYRDAACECLYADLHKAKFESCIFEIASVRSEIFYILKHLKTWMRDEKLRDSVKWLFFQRRIHYEPLGVVLIIGSWNYPFNITLMPLIGALAAGNCVLLKPSEISDSSSKLLKDHLVEYIDPDCFDVICTDAQGTTELLEEHFDYIFYTGNSNIAKVIMKSASMHLTPLTVECGGKSPCIVFDDSDISVAALRIAGGKFLNAGQTCIAPDYVICFESVYNKFLENLKMVIYDMFGSDPMHSDLGRIINAKHFARLQELLENQTIYCGGIVDSERNYVSPTVVIDVRKNDAIMVEEIFGPILPVIAVRDIQEAVDFVNEKDKPLTLYIFTKNSKNSKYVISHTSSGSVCINDTIIHIAQSSLPFGGVGSSGFGRYHGRHSFKTFSNPRAIASRNQSFSWVFRRLFPPYDMAWLKTYEKIIDIQFTMPRLGYMFLIMVVFICGFCLGFFVK